MAASIQERYLRLGLQIGRRVDGMVDAYFGPTELAAEVEAAAPAEPRELVTAAEGLLDELDDGWLRDQVAGLRTYTGVLAGEPLTYTDEAEGCYGVRPTRTDEAVFATAHDRLEALLPGPGSLAERFQGWESSMRVPAEKVEALLLESDGGPELEAVVHDAGVEFDLAHALAVQRAHAPCGWAEVNAGLMLYEDGAGKDEVRDYVERWDLATPEISAHVLRFLRHPTSRTYMITYLAGRELCEAYVGGDPERFRRLLTEQVRASELVESSALSRD
jgi:hypothetical protein